MLRALGKSSVEELFRVIPEDARLQRPLELPQGGSELVVRRAMEALAASNTVFPTVFRGAGAYRHYIPSAVRRITSREEFVTAYTPYQAELSQGLLQSIFEYQTMICELTGMDAANASVYDGATAAAEAAAMCRERGRTKLLVSAAVPPQTMEVLKTYCGAQNAAVLTVPVRDGKTDLDALSSLLDSETAAVLIAQPNYYGLFEDAEELGAAAHAAGAKYIMSCNPISLALLESPAACGADIAVGEGQPLGLPIAFGGPYLGFMAAKSALLRRLPGRIVGQTQDAQGRRAFVLTLQAREQHIRREKASSSICSNQALCALTAAVYLSVMGAQGLTEAAAQCMENAHYFSERLAEAGYARIHSAPFFHEFVTACPVDPKEALARLEARGILGGLPLTGELSGCILWCATELNTRQEIDTLAALLKGGPCA